MVFDINKSSHIYMFDVTVSDFNEFASQMEKVKIANAHEGIIALSLKAFIYIQTHQT